MRSNLLFFYTLPPERLDSGFWPDFGGWGEALRML